MSEGPQVAREVRLLVQAIFDSEIKLPAAYGVTPSEKDDAVVAVVANSLKDLTFIADKDPAAYNKLEYVFEAYPGFHAVLHYRIARALLRLNEASLSGNEDPLLIAARRISERSKVITGIEIHPAAEISAPFAIDHGANTVIGETSVIGSECYFLQAVTLGGREIAGAPPGRRHPEIGDRVLIAGNSQVIGPITIGNDVVIDPGAKITNDIPNGSHVRVLSTMQIVRTDGEVSPTIFGIVPEGRGRIAIFGKSLHECGVIIEYGEQESVEAVCAHSKNGSCEVVQASFRMADATDYKSGVLALKRGANVIARISHTAALKEIQNG